MKYKRVLITGCGGMLGSDMYKVFKANYSEVLATDIDLNEDFLEYLDVRDFYKCQELVEDYKPDLILHLAALTDLEYCEKFPDEAWKTNAYGTENMAYLSKINNITLVYISTAGIFNGEKDKYTDFDTPNPVNYYGASKFYGEDYIKKNLDKYFVLRAGWMMGGLKKDKKFIKKIMNRIDRGDKVLEVVNDKFGSPTYTKNFAESLQKVIEVAPYGLYNNVGLGNCNRAEVARRLVSLLGLEKEVSVTEVTSDYFKDDFSTLRPKYECLENLKLEWLGLNFMRDWKDTLEEYVSEIRLVK